MPAVLIGTNLGPLILLWGSLATLLWRERCAARGLRISAKEFVLVGVTGVPLLLATATPALLVT
jgi:arsenical pump membrane protein